MAATIAPPLYPHPFPYIHTYLARPSSDHWVGRAPCRRRVGDGPIALGSWDSSVPSLPTRELNRHSTPVREAEVLRIAGPAGVEWHCQHTVDRGASFFQTTACGQSRMTVNRTARDVEEGKSKIQDSHRLLRPRLLESPTGAVAAGYAAALDDGPPERERAGRRESWEQRRDGERLKGINLILPSHTDGPGIRSVRCDAIRFRRDVSAPPDRINHRCSPGSAAAVAAAAAAALSPHPGAKDRRHFSRHPTLPRLAMCNPKCSPHMNPLPDPDAERAEAEGQNDEDRS
ncbi:hypothetical protein JHW43_008738 [Diplocarpon mali]|nr:hypothetical protein JHW43_008738 [Diplocarpon mali]